MPVTLALHAASLIRLERFQQRKRDVDWLVVLCLRTGDISRQRADRTAWRRNQKFFTSQKTRGVQTGQPTHRHRFNVAFDAGNLSGKEDILMLAHLHGCREDARSVDISVAMNLAELQKLCALESGNQTQHTRLLAITQMILKADQTISVGHQIFLS